MKPFLAVSLVLISISAVAQTPNVSDQIVVTASSMPESVESTPASVSIITREDIERQQTRDVADVLREVPGLSIARTGSLGKSATLFIRGGSSKQALILWNGVEMNNSYLSGYDFGQLSTTGVERVEVIRGPYSALYGSEAVSGVVNVLTTPVKSAFEATIDGGGNGLRGGSASGSLVRGMWTAGGSVERREDGGFAPNDDFTSDTFTGSLGVVPMPALSIGLMGRYNRFDVGVPRNVNAAGTAFVPTPHRRDHGTESQISLPVRFDGGGLRYELRLSQAKRIEVFGDPDGAFGPEFGNTDSSNRTGRLTVQSGRTAAGVITIGGEADRVNVDHTDSFGLDVRHTARGSRAVFVEDRYSRTIGPGSMEIAIGARYDRFDTFGSQTSPRIAAAWVISNSKWRAAYGEGFRAPAIGELYAPFFGNADLHAERSRNVEIGFDRYVGHAVFSVTAFRSDYNDLISYDVVANRFGNIARARSRGIEGEASRRFGKLSAAVSYTWLKAIDADTGIQLPRRPRNSGSLSAGYDFNPVSLDVVVIHAGQRPDVTDLFPFGAVTNNPYTTADVIVHYDAGSFTPFVKVENATNHRYDEVFGYPSPARRFMAGIRYAIR